MSWWKKQVRAVRCWVGRKVMGDQLDAIEFMADQVRQQRNSLAKSNTVLMNDLSQKLAELNELYRTPCPSCGTKPVHPQPHQERPS